MKTDLNKGSSANDLAETVKQVSTTGAIIRVLKAVGFALLLAVLGIFFIWIGVPWYIGTVVIALAPIIIILDVISLRRISNVKLDEMATPELETVDLEPDEAVTAVIPAVMRYGVTRSYGVMGAGKIITPENALIITNKAIWVLTVPLQGADKVVGKTDIGKWQWMYAYQDIIRELNGMLTILPLGEVLKQGRAKQLMKLSELQRAKTLPYTFAISLLRTDGKRFGYSIRLQEDFKRAKVALGLQ